MVLNIFELIYTIIIIILDVLTTLVVVALILITILRQFNLIKDLRYFEQSDKFVLRIVGLVMKYSGIIMLPFILWYNLRLWVIPREV